VKSELCADFYYKLHGLSTARLQVASAITTTYDARFSVYRNGPLSKGRERGIFHCHICV